MKQKINIKKFIDKHSEAIAVTVSGVAIIVAFTLGHKIGRHVGEADCNRLWNEACDAAGVDRMVLYNAKRIMQEVDKLPIHKFIEKEEEHNEHE